MTDHHDHHGGGHGHGHHTNHTPVTFLAGIIAAVVVGILTFFLVQVILGMLWQGGSALMFWLKFAASAVGGVILGYTFFTRGTFNITPGQRAYLMIFGVPIESLSMGAGDGWLIPGLMTVKIEDGRGKTVNPGEQANTTQNGIEVTSNVAGTYETLDLLHRDHAIEPKDIDPFVKAVLVAAVRAYIADQTLEIDDALMHGELTTEQAFQVIKSIARFRHKVENDNGKNAIIQAANEQLKLKGLRLTSLQIEDVALPAEIESAAKRVLSETVESAGLTKDAKNKASVAEELLKLFGKMGVDLSKLTPEQAADYIDRNLDRAMAAEDKATIRRINFGGTPPKGTMLNTGE